MSAANTCACFAVNFSDKYLETSFDDQIGTNKSGLAPKRTGDSPILQVRRTNLPLNLPDWQIASATEPAEDSPTAEFAPLEPSSPPVSAEYEDQQPVDESPVHAEQKEDISSQPVDWKQLDRPDQIDTNKSRLAPKRTGDSPILQVRRTNLPLNLPDWQIASATEPAEDSPTAEFAPLEPSSPPVSSEYEDQQPVDESPVHAEQKEDISSQPVDWKQLDRPVPTAPPVASFPDITKQIIEGDMYETEEKSEMKESAENGSDCYVRRLVKTRQQLLPVTEVTLEDGVEVSRATSDVVVAVHVDEFVDVLPLGIDDPNADGLERVTSVQESEEPLEAGGTLTRRVVRTTVHRLLAPEISQKPEDWHTDHPAGDEGMRDGKNHLLDSE